jgi:hypothetical protein
LSVEFFLTVHGTGSFCTPPFKTRREGVHKITPEEAAATLAWKEQHPDAKFVVVTNFEPEWTAHEPLTGTLTPLDIAYGTDRAVLVEPDPEDPMPTDDEPVYVYPCDHCPEEFSSAPILRRHMLMHHTTHAADAEDAVREQLAADKEAKAEAERVRTAEPDAVHPAERLDDTHVAGPSLWPRGMSQA